MTTHNFTPVLGKRARITTLDSCGNVTGASQYVTTDGFVSVKLSAETEDGVEVTQKNFTGALCVSEIGNPSFKYFTVEIEFCGVQPDVVTATTNAKPYTDANGDVNGYTVPEGEIDKRFALEIWMGLSGQACAPGAEEASGYMLLPFVAAGVSGDIEMGGEDAVTFSMQSATTKGGNGWGVGPYNVVYNSTGTPSPLPSALDPKDHLLMIDTGVKTPAINGQLVPISVATDTVAPSAAGTLSVTGTPTSTQMTVAVADASDNTGISDYAFRLGTGSNPGTWSAWQSSASYTAKGLTGGTTYSVQHKVRDKAGNETAGEAITVKTADAA